MYSQRQIPTYMDTGFMHLRLSNQQLIEQVEDFLSAKRRGLIKDSNGEFREFVEPKGYSLVNEKGLNHLVQIVAMRTNSLVVQGNFTREEYYDFMEMTRKEIALAIMVNLYDWGIEENSFNYIVDNILAFLIPFTSRLIDNKERDSYQNSFKTTELISTGNPDKKKFMLFK